MEDFSIVKKLSQGGQGSTLLVKHKAGAASAAGDVTMVLKQCKCENLKEANAALKEAKVLQRLDHLSIVRYHDVFLAEEGQYLIICTLMEYCTGGSLTHSRLSELTIAFVLKSVLLALQYLHQNSVVHRSVVWAY